MTMKRKRTSKRGVRVTFFKRPRTIKINTWVEMEYDAKLVFKGVTWYRVHKGFGGRGDREDWVGDLPGVNLSVSDYMWMPSKRWGPVFYRSFEKALEGQMYRALQWTRKQLLQVEEESARQLKDMSTSIKLLEHHLTHKPKQKGH